MDSSVQKKHPLQPGKGKARSCRQEQQQYRTSSPRVLKSDNVKNEDQDRPHTHQKKKKKKKKKKRRRCVVPRAILQRLVRSDDKSILLAFPSLLRCASRPAMREKRACACPALGLPAGRAAKWQLLLVVQQGWRPSKNTGCLAEARTPGEREPREEQSSLPL